MIEHSTFPPIETQRLLLRLWRDADREPWAAMNADSRVRAYFPGLLDRQRSDAAIDLFMTRFAADGFTFWAVEQKETGAFVGFTGLLRTDFEAAFTPCVEIGWRLACPFWGRGYASEAARASLAFGFNQVRLNEIVSFAASSNAPSRRVMERIGMTRDLAGDFIHPKLPSDHPLQPSVLYRVSAADHAKSVQSRSAEEARP